MSSVSLPFSLNIYINIYNIYIYIYIKIIYIIFFSLSFASSRFCFVGKRSLFEVLMTNDIRDK